VQSEKVDTELVEHLHHAKRLGGHEAAAFALYWLEEASNSGLHFDQAGVDYMELPTEEKEGYLTRATLLMHNQPMEEEEEGASSAKQCSVPGVQDHGIKAL